MAKRKVFCLEMPTAGASRGATYGCSLKRNEAQAALARGRKRGVSWGEIVERGRAPRGVRMNEWATPFNRG